ncbi:MAG: Omp28-related outer membrane protein [candidate division WOR-3 bacterium]
MRPRVVFICTFLFLGLVNFTHAVQRTVLAEQFTGTWCQYCPGAQMGLRNLKHQVGDSLTILAYHLSDPFTVPECNVRSSYYGVSGIPHVKFDGVLTRIGGSNTQPVNYRDLFDARRAAPPLVDISLSNNGYNPQTGAGAVLARVTNIAAANITGNLRFAMVGKETAYAWQGQNYLYEVVLGMFPNGATGAEIALTPGEYLLRSYNYTIPSAWRNRQCAIVAFVQNDGTKEVYNAKEMSVYPLEVAENQLHTLRNELTVSPNPVRNSSNVCFVFNNYSNIAVNIYDSRGSIINTFDNIHSRELNWNLKDKLGHKINSGIYFVEIKSGSATTTKKLIVLN